MSRTIEHRVWEIISTDEDLLEKEFSTESLDAQRDAVRYALELWMKFNDLQLHLYHTYNTIKASLESVEDFEAEFISFAEPNPNKDALIAINLGLEIDDIIWTTIEPKVKDID